MKKKTQKKKKKEKPMRRSFSQCVVTSGIGGKKREKEQVGERQREPERRRKYNKGEIGERWEEKTCKVKSEKIRNS